MPTTITGNENEHAGNAAVNDLVAPHVSAPSPLDLGASAQIQALSKRMLDYLASLGRFVKERSELGVGARRVRAVNTVSDLRALTGMAHGDLATLSGAAFDGVTGVLSGPGLFVFMAGATWPESAADGGGWLVVTPGDLSGRWVNAAAGLGFRLASKTLSLPSKQQISVYWKDTANFNDVTTTIVGGTGVLGVDLLVPDVGASDVVSVEFDLSVECSAMSSGLELTLQQYDGVSWLSSNSVRIGGTGASNTEKTQVHLMRTGIPGAGDILYRVVAFGTTGANVKHWGRWTARAIVRRA